jgi:hypothetical protein
VGFEEIAGIRAEWQRAAIAKIATRPGTAEQRLAWLEWVERMMITCEAEGLAPEVATLDRPPYLPVDPGPPAG